MKKFILFPALFPLLLSAQVADDFSDGDFTSAPSWNGDALHFQISSSTAVPEHLRPALKLDAPTAGVSYLSIPASTVSPSEWRFWIKLSFNTSASNFARIYLCTDSPDLKQPLNGYFIQVGGAGDSVALCRQDSLEITRLYLLDSMFTGNSVNMFRLKVVSESTGRWSFFHGPDLEGEWSPAGVFEGNAAAGGWFGISCHYTSSNTGKFYFDDFYAGHPIIDSIPPELLASRVVNPGEVSLVFTEAISAESAGDPANYTLNPGNYTPYEAFRLLEPEKASLFFDPPLPGATSCSLAVSGITDLAGNVIRDSVVPLFYYRALPYDVIITEIMADPSPPKGLPDAEYLEILNRSGYPVELEGWTLSINASDWVLPSLSIPAGNFALFCDPLHASSLQNFGQVIGLNSFSLPNDGAGLLLSGNEGQILCSQSYQLNWYADEDKNEGGWALEMKDIAHPCAGRVNWAASVDPAGGTPGAENSFGAYPETSLSLEQLCCSGPAELTVTFSEKTDSATSASPALYAIEPPDLAVTAAFPQPPAFSEVILQLSQDIPSGTVYTLGISPEITNCIRHSAGNPLSGAFSSPDSCLPYDIVINEILFNPLGDGADFVEIFNRSEKTISLENLFLGCVRENEPEPPELEMIPIRSGCRQMMPGTYVVLTDNPSSVKNQYLVADPSVFLELPGAPGFNNDCGTAMLLDERKTLIDAMDYHENMHHPLLNSHEGVSLERVSADRLEEDESNWQSAAETVGFATPGRRNSQSIQPFEQTTGFTLLPELFSPDGDGRDDQLGIHYAFEEPGKLATILIFNADGRLVRTLVNNELPGTSGIYSWDGLMDDRTAALPGIYVVYLEAIDMEGGFHRAKKACVLVMNR